MRLRKTSVGIAVGATLLVALTGCGAPGSAGGGGGSTPGATGNGPYNLEVASNPSFPAGSTMQKLHDAGTITIGTKFDQPLFGLRGPDGTPVGFDVAIGALVAAKLGIPFEKIKWVETVSANREPFLQSGQVNAVVATYTINDKRKEVVDFAGPYFVAGQSILVLQNNNDIKGPDDLKGKAVCSVEGSTPAATIVNKYGAVLQPTDVYSKCLDPLRNGQVVAMTTDNVILSGFVDQNPGQFKLVGEPFTQEPYGIGLPKGDTAYRTFVNDTLQQAFDDGTWARLFQQTAGKVLPVPNPPTINRY